MKNTYLLDFANWNQVTIKQNTFVNYTNINYVLTVNFNPNLFFKCLTVDFF